MPHVVSSRESLYLDLARALAALAVLLAHGAMVFELKWMPDLGHQAVIVFFVLSGYVISNVAATRETTPRVFLVARFSRLWSVLVPALALTIICDAIGHGFAFRPIIYNDSPIDFPLIRLGTALSFVSESWVSVQTFSNLAAWSLPLEFWYYMVFAAWMFVPPGRNRAIGVGIALFMCGHKGILLFPIWLMGVALHKIRSSTKLSKTTNATLCVIGFLACVWLLNPAIYSECRRATDQFLSPWLTRHGAQARVFWFDWALGLALTTHLLGAPTILSRVPLERFATPIRWAAGISFAAYLFHLPLLRLCAAFLPADQGVLGIALTIAAIGVFGTATERGKYRWRGWLNWLVDRLPVPVPAQMMPAGMLPDRLRAVPPEGIIVDDHRHRPVKREGQTQPTLPGAGT